MGKINLKRTLNNESREKVVEQKSSDSREKVAESCEKIVVPNDMRAKLDEILSIFDTLDEPVNNSPVVTEPPIPKDQHSKQSRSEYHKAWAKNKAQISFRITVDLKEQIDQHIKNRKEPLARFVIRAIEEQIKRDNAE